MILARNVEKVLSELGFSGEVSAVAVADLPNRPPAQLILATHDIANELPAGNSELIRLSGAMDLEGIKEALLAALG